MIPTVSLETRDKSAFRDVNRTRISGMDDFYDRLAPLYDLIFVDWDASMEQ